GVQGCAVLGPDAGLRQHALHGRVVHAELPRDRAHAPALGVEEAQDIRLAFFADHGVPLRRARKSPSPDSRPYRRPRCAISNRTSALSAGHSSSPRSIEPGSWGERASTCSATHSGSPLHRLSPSSIVSSARGWQGRGSSRALSRSPSFGLFSSSFASCCVTRSVHCQALIIVWVLRGPFGADVRVRPRHRHRLSAGLCRWVLSHFVCRKFAFVTTMSVPAALHPRGVQARSPWRPLVRGRGRPLGCSALRAGALVAAVALAAVTPRAQAHLRPAPLALIQSPRLFGSHSWCRRGASFSGQRRRSRAHRASVRSLFGTIARRLGRFRPGPSLFSALRSYASRMSAGNFSAAQPVKESGHEARSSPEPRAFRRPSTGTGIR